MNIIKSEVTQYLPPQRINLQTSIRITGEKLIVVKKLGFESYLKANQLQLKQKQKQQQRQEGSLNTSFEFEENDQEQQIEADQEISNMDIKLWQFQELKHRNLCQLVDFEVEYQSNRKFVYLLSEAFNASLQDLYFTSKNENMEFTEEQLIEIAFQVLKSIQYLNGKGLNLKGMLRMENINFDERSDVWTLGVILLLCMSLEYEVGNQEDQNIFKIMKIVSSIRDKSLLHQGESEMQNNQSLFESASHEKEEEESDYWRLISGDFIEKKSYSPLFMDFIQECLIIDENERQNAQEILSHPIFKDFNNIYIKQQLIFTDPITITEKQHIQFLRQQEENQVQQINVKKLLEISVLKACENDKDSFLEFLQKSFKSKEDQDTENQKEQEMPMFIRIQNSKTPYIQQIHSGQKLEQANTRFLENLLITSKPKIISQTYSQLIIKPDLNQFYQSKNLTIDNLSVFEDSKSQKSGSTENEVQKQTGPNNSFAQGLISDQMSTQSSFMDRISSIFTLGRAAQPQASNKQDDTPNGKKQNRSSGNTETGITNGNGTTEADSQKVKKEDKLKRYIHLLKLLDSQSTSFGKLSQAIRKNQDILRLCKYLRRKVWTRLLPDTNPYLSYIFELQQSLQLTHQSVCSKEVQQVWNDIRRCEHFHPLLESDLVKKRLHSLLITFLELYNGEVCYVQGLDSIAVVLFSEYQDKDHLILPMLKQIFVNYLKHFLDEKNNLSFGYSSLLIKRLLSFYEPELYVHFNEIEFTHNLYLVCWVMTLFAHTISISHVVNIWTDLFCEKVEFLFFISLAILTQIKDKLLLLDLNSTLSIINNIQGLIDIEKVLNDAREYNSKTPQSFVQSDFVFDTKKSQSDFEMLKQNEYFAQRWWELEYLDYNDQIDVCIINCEDAINLKCGKFLIDIRDIEAFNSFFLKGSYFMDSENETEFQIYCDFLTCYHEQKPDDFIIIIGDKQNYGYKFAQKLIKESGSIGRLCILKGGIDAIVLEYHQLLRKKQQSSTNNSQKGVNPYLQQYEKFIKKFKQVKQLQSQGILENK